MSKSLAICGDRLDVDFEAIRETARRIEPCIHRTPVLTSRYFNELLGAEVYFKCENFQRAGAFKIRGACNAVLSLDDEQALRGVVTHSSGNHGQAMALAAKMRGIKATVVMPRNAMAVKLAAVEGYGAQVVLCDQGEVSRQAAADEVIRQTNATLIHSYNDPHIVAGQATACLELIEEAGPLDLILAPLGGGGLLSGTALAAKVMCPDALVIGVEPAGADDGLRSLEAGRILPSASPRTIADGLLMPLGDLTFKIIRKQVSAVVLVDDDAIIDAMRRVWQRMKIVIEPSAATVVAALVQARIEASHKRIGVIFSGGNVDLDKLPW